MLYLMPFSSFLIKHMLVLWLIILIFWFLCVLDLGEGVCADPVNGGAILGKGGPDPQGGNKERQLSPDKERDRTWYVVKWEDDNRAWKMTPSQLQDASMHRVSWCAQLEDKSECVSDVYSCTYCIYCFRKINHLVPVPFVFILWCKKPCREHYVFNVLSL
jgi:hypothetical protein